MAANGRFDLSLSRPDGPAYGTGHRVPYAIAPLEKPGSFREGSDRIFSSPHGTSKSSTITSQGEMTCLLQSLASDLKGVVPDPKLNRPGEMKRAMSSIFGASTENSSSSTFETKQFPSSSLEGIKRLKNNLQESSTKARDRAKTFDAACSMIDKFWHLKRKRSRIGYSSNVRTTGLYQGGSIPKTGLQSYASGSGLEIGSQREEKPKIGVPNRRIRTSLLEMDVQTNGTTRISGPLERDKDMLKPINGSATQLVENDSAFSAVADGWERSKLKKKRSVIKSDASSSSGLSRSQGGEREVKRGMQHKLGIDARSRINHAHSFRPGSDSSITMVGNSDTSPQQHAPSMRSRNEINNGSLQNDKKDIRFCPDTESASLKVISKPNSREDRCAASPSLLKFNSFRTRTNPSSLPKTSANIHRVVGNPEDMELPQATEKLNALGVTNRKRAASVRSSSPPVGQWAVQRPKKFSRSSRRSSLSPLVSSHDELIVSDAVDETSIHHDSLGEARHASLNASQQGKMRGDHLAASLSESEESGIQENKVKCKVNKFTEMEDKSDQTVQKPANLIMASRKNRMAVEEDSGDGDRRQGRIGRGFAPARSGLSATIEKLGEAVTAKQQRSVRYGSERVESKPDRPPIKKLSERKAYTRPKQSINILSMESSEEAADDQEELVAAATAALDTGRACSSSLWKQLEPVFSFVSSEDTAFLLEQIQLTNESAARTHADGDNSQNLKVDHEHVTMLSGPVVTNTWKNTALSNGTSSYECERERGFTKETVHADPLLNSGISICQALLSAIIGEEEMENIYSTVDYGEGYSYEDCYAAQFELDKGLKSKVLNLQLLEDSQAARKISDCYKVDSNWRLCDEISTERSETNGTMETYNRPIISSFQQAPTQLVPKQTTSFSTACTEFQYGQMSINDRLVLELSEIGLYPEVEPVPDLTYGEDEDITESIHMLEVKLHEQASNRKSLLLKLEKSVMDAKELQQRRLECLAMDRLVQIAYDRYMACWGPSTSGIKNANKVVKHASLAFVKRTLARFQKFEETGISCFNQPVFSDIFHSVSSRCSNSQSMNIPSNDHNIFMSSQIARKVDTHSKSSNAAQGHPFIEDDPWSNRVKKKEIFLDDVAGSTVVPSSRTPGLGNSLVSGAKGKRSERDRDGKGHSRDPVFKNGTTKIGRPATSSGTKGERKNKSKPKIKTTQLSASVNVLHGKNTDMLVTGSSLIPKSSGFGSRDAEKKDNSSLLPESRKKKMSNDRDAVDLSNLQLPDIDVGDFDGQGHDIASWLNFEDEGLQDHDDCMGLEIPMDDLSDVHMMI